MWVIPMNFVWTVWIEQLPAMPGASCGLMSNCFEPHGHSVSTTSNMRLLWGIFWTLNGRSQPDAWQLVNFPYKKSVGRQLVDKTFINEMRRKLTFNGVLEFRRSGCSTYKSVFKSHGLVNVGFGTTFGFAALLGAGFNIDGGFGVRICKWIKATFEKSTTTKKRMRCLHSGVVSMFHKFRANQMHHLRIRQCKSNRRPRRQCPALYRDHLFQRNWATNAPVSVEMTSMWPPTIQYTWTATKLEYSVALYRQPHYTDYHDPSTCLGNSSVWHVDRCDPAPVNPWLCHRCDRKICQYARYSRRV